MKTKNKILLVLLILGNLFCQDQQIVEGNKMTDLKNYKIRIVCSDKIVEAILENTPTSNDFISLLPLTTELKDYAATEKITYLERKLTTNNSPKGYDPSIEDITYYAPWGNIAIFYKDFGYADGLIKLGKITRGLEILQSDSVSKVIIELVD